MSTLWILGALCPGCKESLGPAQAQAFEWSIYLLLGLVYGICAVLAAVVWRTCRREAVSSPRT